MLDMEQEPELVDLPAEDKTVDGVAVFLDAEPDPNTADSFPLVKEAAQSRWFQKGRDSCHIRFRESDEGWSGCLRRRVGAEAKRSNY